jgi:putative drug exporter of the RND superfamily
VRSILVPALLLDIGDRVWWPSRIADRAQRPGDALERGGR